MTPLRDNVLAILVTGGRPWFTPSMGSEDSAGSQDSEPRRLVDAADVPPAPVANELERRETAVQTRETAVQARESAVRARETAVRAREAGHDDRMDAGLGIRAAADRRDAESGRRDEAAEKREDDLDRAEMLDPGSDYGSHWPERRNAGMDRTHAKDDRMASHDDRVALTESTGKDGEVADI